MIRVPTVALRRTALPALAFAAVLLAACDRDPSAPARTFPTVSILNDSIVGQQEALRLFFAGDSLSAATALDPANFVVVNECTGLRVPGAIRLGRGPTGDTLIFTPTQALPYLTALGLRVQNLLTSSGTALALPATFAVRTVNPPVTDVSWRLVDSPTNDFVTGVNFVDRTTGYAIALGGSVYRSTDGGETFAARYKDLGTSFLFDVRAFGDTVYMVGVRQIGSGTHYGILRSVDAGVTFTLAFETSSQLFLSSMRRTADGNVVGVEGGALDKSYVYRFDAAAGTLTESSGVPSSDELQPSGVDISPTSGQNAVATFAAFPATSVENTPVAVRSVDGGRTFTPISFPSGVYTLLGTGFINDTDALLLGDSSVVLRVNTTTGVVTALGAAQGIPQTVRNGPSDFTAYSFTRARFAPGSQLGFIVGTFTRRRPGLPDVVNGVVLISRDGGATFERQGITGAPDDGLGFPPVNDVQTLADDFAALSGANGLLALRTSNAVQPTTVCSVNQQP